MSLRGVQVSTYSDRPPLGGGKIRLRKLKEAMASRFEMKTVYFEAATKTCVGDGLLEVDIADFEKEIGSRHLFDVCLPQYLSRRPQLLLEFVSQVFDSKPDFLVVEQPYLWPVIRARAIAESVPVFYSSHNIETILKRRSFEYLVDGSGLMVHLDPLRDIELDIARHSLGVLTVSEADRQWYLSEGGLPQEMVAVFPNGTDLLDDRKKSAVQVDWRSRLDAFGKKLFLYVASYHMPNIRGFLEYCPAPWTALDPHQACVALCGSVGGGIWDFHPDPQEFARHQNLIKIVGLVSDEERRALIETANVILLPVAAGGGTNLKTPEALVSGREIVASRHAFNGFEEWQCADGVYLASGPDDFMRRVYQLGRQSQVSSWEREGCEKLSWRCSLSGVSNFILKSLEGPRAMKNTR